MRSLLRTLAIAEYGDMGCSISLREPSEKGTEALCLVPLWEPEHTVIVSLVDVFGPIKGSNACGIGSSAVPALKRTALTYSERRERFETYHCEVARV